MKEFFEIPLEPSEFIERIELRHPGWKVFFEKEHQSTQIIAKDAFQKGFDYPAVCVVKNQVAGRGRRDRGWVSSPDGEDLTMSLIIPLTIPYENPALLNILGGISVVEAVTDLTGFDFKVKWPNDIFHRRSKIGGIISELLVTDALMVVIMGIGVNVNSKKDFFSAIESFYDIDTLSSITGKKHDLALLIITIIDRLLSNIPLLDEDFFPNLEKKWKILGRECGIRIKYREIQGEWAEGVACGISPEGYLLVKEERGEEIKTLVEGDVVPVE